VIESKKIPTKLSESEKNFNNQLKILRLDMIIDILGSTRTRKQFKTLTLFFHVIYNIFAQK
jgi:hypothetical protein